MTPEQRREHLILRALKMILYQMARPEWSDYDKRRKEKITALIDDITVELGDTL